MYMTTSFSVAGTAFSQVIQQIPYQLGQWMPVRKIGAIFHGLAMKHPGTGGRSQAASACQHFVGARRSRRIFRHWTGDADALRGVRREWIGVDRDFPMFVLWCGGAGLARIGLRAGKRAGKPHGTVI